MKAILMLEDGKAFYGQALAAGQDRIGTVILNTAVVGYQEMITDPANAGKILVPTYPLIGNYGCAPKFNESKKAWVSGLVIKEKSRIYSNWQAKGGFDDFIRANNVVLLENIDTRTLAVHLRQKGEMSGIISSSAFEAKDLLARIAAYRCRPAISMLPGISVKKITPLDAAKPKSKKVAVVDIGITSSLLKQLKSLGFRITLLPYNTKPEEILRLKPRGLIVSGGPEEDAGLEEVANNIKVLLGKIPMLGISTGHQVIARALGAKIIKMKLGHHGVNCPVGDPTAYRGEITAQNHSYVVDADSLNRIRKVKITAYNLNDRSVEEIESKKLKILSTQYIPASPGLDEVSTALKKFAKIIN